MKKQILMGLASLMLIGAAGVRAAENKEATPKPPAGERKKPSGEELSPEERAKRRKEAIEKREAKLKELRDKKAAGTLNDAEKNQLERLEKQADRAKRAKEDGGGNRPRKSRKPDAGSQAS